MACSDQQSSRAGTDDGVRVAGGRVCPSPSFIEGVFGGGGGLGFESRGKNLLECVVGGEGERTRVCQRERERESTLLKHGSPVNSRRISVHSHYLRHFGHSTHLYDGTYTHGMLSPLVLHSPSTM